MARVVQQQRKAPPYALIIFVFLFLVATTLAVYLYIEQDKAIKDSQAKELETEKLASGRELNDPIIKEMMRAYEEKVRNRKPRTTVVGKLVEQVNELTQKINGVVTTPKDAIAKTDALYTEIGDSGGLIEMVRGAYKQRDEEKEARDKLKTERENALKERDQVKISHGNLVEQHKTWRETSNEEMKTDRESFKRMTEQQDKGHVEAKVAWDVIRQDKDKKAAGLMDQLHAADTKKRQLLQTIAVLEDKIRKMRKRVEVITKPDGKVLSLADGRFCFINLGANDGVETGFAFAVYPQTGIPKDGVNKGSIVVTSVGQDVSRCRVTRQSRTSPVIPNDLVANVAFDSIRKWRFLVEGDFDLNGTGEPTPEGAVEAKLLLRRFGATIAEEVGVDVDFVVLGVEPPTPARPEEDAAAQIWEAWRQAVKKQKRYSQIKKQAGALGVPTRNRNWLLDMTGYTPIKALREVARP